MPVPSTEAKVADRTESTIDLTKNVTELVVDPGYDGSFSVNLAKMASEGTKVPPRDPKAGVSRDESLRQALSRMRTDTETAPRMGRATPTVDGGNHGHPDAHLPANVVAPPQTRVHFDIPGYASVAFKYHSVKRIQPGYLVFVTDRRHTGTADFYPYANKMAAEGATPIGAYVDGGKKMYLLKPGSIVFVHEPYEFCLVPIADERPLPPDLMTGFAQEELRAEVPVPAKEGRTHDGEERGHRGGDDAPGEWPERPALDGTGAPEIDPDNLDLSAGGKGGVL